VTAVDADVGDNARIAYTLSGEGADKFAVNVLSGVITASESLDRETQPRYSFHVVAVDAGIPALSSSVLVVVDLLDVNDHSPVFYRPRGYVFDVVENLPGGTELGMVGAEDKDSGTNGAVRYQSCPIIIIIIIIIMEKTEAGLRGLCIREIDVKSHTCYIILQ